jgi:predicted nucleic acid-binding protein
MAITLDASTVAAWLLPDEAGPTTDRLYEQAAAAAEVFQAPALLAWEAGNLLRSACLRRRLTPKLAGEALQLFSRAGVRLDSPPGERRLRDTFELAQHHGLSFYDASYLEQALRTGAQMATKDVRLRREAAKAGVVCLDL